MFSVFVFLFLFLVSFVPQAHAFDVLSGESARLDAGQTISGSLFIVGNSVTVDGVVMGDVYCAGQNVVISGRVDGDIICAGQSMRITGPVGGNVRVVGQSLDLDGAVARNVTIAGQNIAISRESTIAGELMFGAQSVDFSGAVAKGVAGAGQNVLINGSVGGDINLQAETLELGERATVTGKLGYMSDKEARISNTATVSGAIARSQLRPDELEKEPREISKRTNSWPINTIPAIVLHIVIGLLVVGLFGDYTKRVQKCMTDNPVWTSLKGAALLFFAPVFILALFLTIIGIPAALLGIVLYALPVSLSRLFVATVVGQRLLDVFAKKTNNTLYAQILVGVPVVWFMLKAPLIGGILTFLAIIWGMGGILGGLRSQKK